MKRMNKVMAWVLVMVMAFGPVVWAQDADNAGAVTEGASQSQDATNQINNVNYSGRGVGAARQQLNQENQNTQNEARTAVNDMNTQRDQGAMEKIAEAKSKLQKTLIKIGQVLQKIGQILQTVGKILMTVGAILSAIPFTAAIGAMLKKVGNILHRVGQVVQKVGETLEKIGTMAANKDFNFVNAAKMIADTAKTAWQNSKAGADQAQEQANQNAQGFVDAIRNFTGGGNNAGTGGAAAANTGTGTVAETAE